MSISKNSLRPFDSSVQSGARSINSDIINWFCTALFGGLLLLGGSAKAAPALYNVLINPGAETGDLTGWNVSSTGYNLVVSTNSWIPNTTNNYLAHSGMYMFQQFDVTADSAYMYQDYPAVAGSQWSASVWAICYASNYFDTAIAYMSVAFYDTNGNVVKDDPINPDPGTVGVYGSDVLDPNPLDTMPGVIVPPPAVDATGWLYLPATNFWYSYIPANTNGAPGINIESGQAIPVSTNLTAPIGTAFVRYQLEYDNWSDDGGAVYWDDCVLAKLTWSDPDIQNPQPVSQTIYAGSGASFTVNAVQQLRAETLTYQWQKNGTNLPPAGGINDIQGATTNATLYLTNCVGADAGNYTVLVWDSPSAGVTNHIRSVPATLTVLIPPCPPRGPNRLGNPGFENGPILAPWNSFNGCYPVGPTNTYAGSTTPVNIFDGSYCCLIGYNGDRDNGLYQVVTGITPGTIWKAGAWAYISSLNDFAGNNTERIQIWFKDSGGITVGGTPTYESFKLYGLAYTNADMQYTNIDTSSPYYGQVMLHDQLPRDQWCLLPVTNVVNNAGLGLGDDLPYTTLTNGLFMVPTNANIAQINFQVYELCPVASDNLAYSSVATDAVYWDDCYLIQILPVTNLTASVSGANVILSFGAGAGLNYSILYRNNLTDATWLVLTNVIAPMSWQTNFIYYGTTYPITVIDPISAQSRFYRIQVQ